MSADAEPSPPRRPIRDVVTTVTGNLYLVVFTLLFGTFAILTGWLGRGAVFYLWARWWSRGLLAASGVRVRSILEAPVPEGPLVFMANHQSLFDIPVLIATLPRRARFLAKKELFALPIFGWALRVGGFIPVDRGNPSAARETFALASERLGAGGAILVFPEETRSLDGQLLPFRRGAFLLAVRGGARVVPVGIRGSLGVRPKGSFRIHSQCVEVHYGPAIEVAGAERSERPAREASVRAEIARLADVGDPRAADGKVQGPPATERAGDFEATS